MHDDVSETIIRKEELVRSGLYEVRVTRYHAWELKPRTDGDVVLGRGLHLNYSWGWIPPPLVRAGGGPREGK